MVGDVERIRAISGGERGRVCSCGASAFGFWYNS